MVGAIETSTTTFKTLTMTFTERYAYNSHRRAIPILFLNGVCNLSPEIPGFSVSGKDSVDAKLYQEKEILSTIQQVEANQDDRSI